MSTNAEAQKFTHFVGGFWLDFYLNTNSFLDKKTKYGALSSTSMTFLCGVNLIADSRTLCINRATMTIHWNIGSR